MKTGEYKPQQRKKKKQQETESKIMQLGDKNVKGTIIHVFTVFKKVKNT